MEGIIKEKRGLCAPKGEMGPSLDFQTTLPTPDAHAILG